MITKNISSYVIILGRLSYSSNWIIKDYKSNEKRVRVAIKRRFGFDSRNLGM